MSDIDRIVRMLRVSESDPVQQEAADALEAQAKEIAEKNARITGFVEMFDKMMGTPCEQVRHGYEVEELRARIAELEAALEAQAKRIAELEVPLCIGKRTIGIMAEEGCWQSSNGRAVVAADELFKQDPYARIAELEAALEPFRRVKAVTSIYEYVPVEALRDDETFNFRMSGAEMKTIYALLNGKG